jgi:serine-type D-Ala-D-Ala carboxypeptidase (penicillin-binding protein 5/6)
MKIIRQIILSLMLLSIGFNQGIVFAAETEEHPPPTSESINSEAAILMDGTTGKVLFEKDSNRLMYPASITKIATGIIAIEEGNLDDIVTVSAAARNADGTRVYLEEGEQVTLLKLVQGLMINSGNDAAIAIAEHMDGSVEKFAERMNRFIKDKAGVKNTTFTNPHGLFDENHQTTASDMALITQYAMKNPKFRSIVGTKEMEWIGEGWETTLYNHHKLLWRYEGVTGVKNGFVNESGNTLVTTAERGDMDLIAVTLKADSSELSYSDTVMLLDYGFEHFQTNTVPVNPALIEGYKAKYVIPEQLVFTSNKNDKFEVMIDEAAQAIYVSGSDGTRVYSEKLELVPQPEPVSKIAPEKSKPIVGTVIMLILIAAISFLIVRKRRRKRRRSVHFK